MNAPRSAIGIILCLVTGCQTPLNPTSWGRSARSHEPTLPATPALEIESERHTAGFAGTFFEPPGIHVRPAAFLDPDDAIRPVIDGPAQPVPPYDDTQSLDQLEQTALGQNPAIAQATARLSALHGKWLQVGLPPNPTLGYVGEEIGDEGTAGSQGGYVSQQFITGHKLGLSRRVLCKEIWLAEQRLAVLQQRVLTDVRTGFYDILILQRKLDLVQELVSISEKAVRTSQQLLAAKEIPYVGLLQTQVDARQTRIVRRRTENEYAAAWRRLNSVLGRPDMPPVRVSSSLEPAATELAWEQQLGRLLAESPELATAAAELERAHAALARARAEAIPDVTLQFALQQNNVSDSTVSGVQVGVPLPIWNQNQGGIQQAWGEVVVAERSIDRMELVLRRRLAGSFQQYSDARYQVEEYSGQILPKARETFRLVTEGYEQGEVGYLDLLTAQRTYFQTSLAYIEALRELWRSALLIEGKLLDGSLRTGEQPRGG